MISKIKNYIKNLRLSEKLIMIFYTAVFLWEIVFVLSIKQ